MVVTKRRNIGGTITIIKGMSTNCMLTSIFILYIPVLLCSFHVYCADRISLRYGELIRDNETLVSPGGEFEFGFFSPSGSSGYKRYVGIWYKWDKRTVVWVANRDDPLVNSNGTFGIGTNGTLQVLDTSSRKVHWYREPYYWCGLCTTANMIVNLTDYGNLVLYDNETSLWESFENPTDTFLPRMSMSEDISLTSWRDRDDPGIGNYTIKQDPLDVGDLNTLIIYQGKTIYWKSVKDDQLSNISGYFFEDVSTGNAKCPKRSNTYRCRYFYDSRLVMNFSGKIELWQQKNRTWSLIEEEPRDICSVYNFCGKFGSCNPNNKVVCKCLPGFMPDVPEKWHSGDFSNGCAKKDKSCGDRDPFLSLKMMIGGENPQGIYAVNNENECKETCLKNCECKSYSYDEKASCWIWTQDLLNLREEYPSGRNLSVRVAISDIGNLLSGRFYFLYEFA